MEYKLGAAPFKRQKALKLPPVPTAFVESITYNARGQREEIHYGNNTHTEYSYDAARYWLTQLKTIRPNPEDPSTTQNLQNLSYTRDKVGNITEITDSAQRDIFFSNTLVTPTRTFRYDSLYHWPREGRPEPEPEPEHAHPKNIAIGKKIKYAL